MTTFAFRRDVRVAPDMLHEQTPALLPAAIHNPRRPLILEHDANLHILIDNQTNLRLTLAVTSVIRPTRKIRADNRHSRS